MNSELGLSLGPSLTTHCLILMNFVRHTDEALLLLVLSTLVVACRLCVSLRSECLVLLFVFVFLLTLVFVLVDVRRGRREGG